MPKKPLADFLHYLYRLYPDHDSRGDGELLRRFVAQKDDAAFAALIGRHGRLVQGVCRRILGDFHSAEDCFQGTFIVLARRAGSIRMRQSFATWLYAVAQRVSLRARAKAALSILSGQTVAAGCLSGQALALAEQVISAVAAKAKLVALLAIGLAISTTGYASYAAGKTNETSVTCVDKSVPVVPTSGAAA